MNCGIILETMDNCPKSLHVASLYLPKSDLPFIPDSQWFGNRISLFRFLNNFSYVLFQNFPGQIVARHREATVFKLNPTSTQNCVFIWRVWINRGTYSISQCVLMYHANFLPSRSVKRYASRMVKLVFNLMFLWSVPSLLDLRKQHSSSLVKSVSCHRWTTKCNA